MRRFDYNPKEYDIFIGLDVDRRSYVINEKDHKNMNRVFKIASKPESFEKHLRKRYSDKRVVCLYESGPTGYGLHDYLTKCSIRCLMVSPLTIPKAPNSRVKTNRIDAEKLAQHLKNGDLKPIRVPDHEYRELRQLVRSRQDYARQIRTTKQRIKSLLLAQSLEDNNPEAERSWSNRYISRLKTIQCTPAVRQRLDRLLDDLDYHRRQELHVRKETFKFCQSQPSIEQNIQYLRSVPGIGFIVASGLLGNIGNPHHLKRPQELAGYLGLAPCEYSSGDKVWRGGITHMGNAELRAQLIQAAWITIRYDKKLRQLYDRIRTRNTPGIGARKAIVAVARKLTLIVYRILKDQRNYISY